MTLCTCIILLPSKHHFFFKLALKRSNTFLETSAVTGHNVKKAFYMLAEALIHSYGIFQPGQEVSGLVMYMDAHE